MTISVTCKKCGKVLKSPAQYAGKPVKCPDCDTVNRLPDAATEVCSLCKADFSSDTDKVKDTKGNLYHRSCYDKKKAEKEAAELCKLCGENFAADPDRVKDNKGNLFHRHCYNEKKEALRKQRLALLEKEERTKQRQEEDKRRREQQEKEQEKREQERREQEKRNQEAEQAPSKKLEPREETCEICGETLSSAADRFTNLKGNVLHRSCYDNRESGGRGGRGGQRDRCQLCGEPFTDAVNVVKDPHGRYYHRNCYEEEKARLAPLDLSSVPEVDSLDEFDDGPLVAETGIVAPKPLKAAKSPGTPKIAPSPHLAQPPQPSESEDEFRLAPIDGERKPVGKAPAPPPGEPSDDEDIPTLTVAEETAPIPVAEATIIPADNADLVPIEEAGLVPINDAGLVPMDDAVLQPLGSPINPLDGVTLEPLSPGVAPLETRKESVPKWLYTMMGCGAAVPIILLLVIIVQSILGPSQPDTGPVATTEQAAPADVNPVDPGGVTQPYTPPVPDQPYTPPTPSYPSGGQPDGSYSDPTNYNDDEAPSRDPTAAVKAFLASGAAGLVCLGIGLLILAVIHTVFFRAACSICGETAPGFGEAFLVVGAAILVGGVVSFVASMILPPSLGWLSIVSNTLVFAGAYTMTMGLSFGKALAIAVVQMVLLIIVVVVLVGGLVFLVMVSAGA